MQQNKTKNEIIIMDLKSCYLITFIIFILTQSACTKFVQVDPPTTQLVSTNVYSSNSGASSVLTGIYDNMVTGTSGGLSGGQLSISNLCGCAADELTNFSSRGASPIYYSNSYTSDLSYFWQEAYKEIYVSNAAIEGISNSKNITAGVKNQLLGEAKFIRAFLYFYATNLFGDVPLVTTTNYQANNTLSRVAQADVYKQIIADLKDAKDLLSDNFLSPTNVQTTERVRPNKGAAEALLARVYLYTGDWLNAEAMSDLVINNSGLYSLDTLNAVFLKNSNEAIWQLQSITPGYNTFDGNYFVLTSTPGTGLFAVSLSPQILNAFEPGDSRLDKWVGRFVNQASGTTYYYPYKYKQGAYNLAGTVTEYTMVLRLAEQYLIRAEARANQGKLTEAASDLNAIRNRANLPNTTATSQADLLSAIYHERRIELFTEWGHRWLDLKRTDSVNSVMSLVTPLKGGIWNSFKALFPIPRTEIQLNGNLVQNTGYN